MPPVVVDREERRLQEPVDESLRRRALADEALERPLALDALRRARVLVPLDLVPGGSSRRPRASARRRGRARGTRCRRRRRVDDRQRVREVVRQPAQRRPRLLRRLARLEQVADDERHAEAAAHDLAPAERERDGETGVVEPVEQPPGAVAGADHGPHPARCGGSSPRAARARSRSSARGSGRRRCHTACEQPARYDGGAHIPRKRASRSPPPASAQTLLVRGDELRHVLLQRPQRGRVGRARRLALVQEPRPVAGPVALEERRPARPRLELLDRLERQHVSQHLERERLRLRHRRHAACHRAAPSGTGA